MASEKKFVSLALGAQSVTGAVFSRARGGSLMLEQYASSALSQLHLQLLLHQKVRLNTKLIWRLIAVAGCAIIKSRPVNPFAVCY